MQQIVDIYIVYQIVKKITTPFEKTDAYKLGIIDAHGNVLRPRKTLSSKEKNAWTWLDILTNNIKRAFAVVPGGASKFFSYAASYFLLREPVVKLKEMTHLEGTPLLEAIFGPASNRYLMEAADLTEDAGAMGGPGLGPTAGAGYPGNPSPAPTPSVATQDTFAGCKVFVVDSDTFRRCRFGKKKYARYEQYVGSGPIGEDIKNYGRKYTKKGIIIMDERSGVMFYLRRPKGPQRWAT